MSKFNATVKPNLTTNEAGGQAYKKSAETEFLDLILTSFVEDQYYRSSSTALSELKRLINELDPLFVAKAAIFARHEYGMRSITHVIACELAKKASGNTWAKNFYERVINRPDDMTEILSYYLSNNTDGNNPKFPGSLKKGFAKAFDKFDQYQLAKYKSSNKGVKLVDVVNIVHPVPTDRNKEALNLLVNDNLKNEGTWEAMLSKAGQVAENEEELSQMKSDAWEQLVTTRKIGYFALLRNLRNIINQAPHIIDQVCNLLVDERLIKNSKVLPFRFSTAYDEMLRFADASNGRKVISALDKAVEISLSNIPKFEGETLLVVDTSGSMGGRPSEIASVFAGAFMKRNNCDVMKFDNFAKYVSYNQQSPVFELGKTFRFSGGGTNFKDIFLKANKRYDRVIILSDMQGWVGHTSPVSEFNEYKRKFKANPFLYSWDLTGYSTTQFPERNVFCLSGFNDNSFKTMSNLEIDKDYLKNEINKIEL
ncbi:TROVE domain-containing protein [bacterium]|nr:TROVE domain-containing protein [bacterium]